MIALRTLSSRTAPTLDLVLIHAFPLTSTMYEAAAAEIQKLRSDVVIHLVDLPGYGKAAYRDKWTLAEAMQALHMELKSRNVVAPVIGGTSMGGYAVLAYARLFSQEISGLILSNTKASGDEEAAKRNREIVALDVEKRGHEAIYEKMLDKLVSETSKKNRPELTETLRSWIAASDPLAIAATSRALARRDDSMDLLSTIEVPALIVLGEEDAIIPAEESKKMQAIRNSHVVTIPGTGHLSAVEDPKAWGEHIVNFLLVLAESPL